MNIVRLQNFQIKMVLIIALAIVPLSSQAIERAGYLGQSWSVPLFLTTPHHHDEVTSHFDMAYFLDEKWTASLSLNTQVEGLKYFYLEFGPDYYPIQDVIVLPFISARLLYTMLPAGNAGWMSQVGFETHLGGSDEVENFRLRVSSGVGQFFVDKENELYVEIARIGLIWSF